MASIKKKSKGGGGANWMDTYGDMVTLLLCFFVLLYSISTIDESKWIMIVKSFNKDAVVNENDTPPGPEGEESEQGGNDMPMTQEDVNNALDQLYEFLVTYAASSSDSISISKGDGYVFISFDDAVFFEGEKYDLLPEGKATLDAIIPALESAGPFIDEVRVLGHTAQGSPNRANNIRRDRTLSSDRANEVLIYILENSDPAVLDPARFLSLGYGQWRPIALNDDAVGRAKNRRVEMIISGRDVEEGMEGNIAQYYEETNQAPPGVEILPPEDQIPEVDAPVVDQATLDLLGPEAFQPHAG